MQSLESIIINQIDIKYQPQTINYAQLVFLQSCVSWNFNMCKKNYQPEVLENLTWKLPNTITIWHLDQILIVWLIWMMEHCLQFQYHSLVSPWFHCKSQCLLRCPSCKAWHADSSIQYCIANWLLLHAHPLKNYRQANRKTNQEPGGCNTTKPLLLQDWHLASHSFLSIVPEVNAGRTGVVNFYFFWGHPFSLVCRAGPARYRNGSEKCSVVESCVLAQDEASHCSFLSLVMASSSPLYHTSHITHHTSHITLLETDKTSN